MVRYYKMLFCHNYLLILSIFNFISEYLNDTYGECKILTVTRKTGESEVEYYIVLKFAECGNANRVKQR